MCVYMAVKFLETEKLLDEKAILMFLFLVNYMQGENSTIFLLKKKHLYKNQFLCLFILFYVRKEHLNMYTECTIHPST